MTYSIKTTRKLENIKPLRDNNERLWVRKIHGKKLLNFKAKRTSILDIP